MRFNLSILGQLTKLPPIKRRLLIILIDSFLLEISFLLSLWLTKSFIPNFFYKDIFFIALFVLLAGVFLYTFSGQYKGITKYIDSKLFYKICLYNFILSILSDSPYFNYILDNMNILNCDDIDFFLSLTSNYSFFNDIILIN